MEEVEGYLHQKGLKDLEKDFDKDCLVALVSANRKPEFAITVQ